MPVDLGRKPINGYTIRAYDEMIKAWVLEKLRDLGNDLTIEDVQNIVNDTLAANNVVDQSNLDSAIYQLQNMIMNDVKVVVNKTFDEKGITEERVQEMIDESVGVVMNAAY